MIIYYAKQVVDGKVVCLTTYENEPPIFEGETALTWSEITKEEYDQILAEIMQKAETERLLALEQFEAEQDVEITDEEG